MSTKLYVGNLSFRIAEGELHDAFGQFGNVTEVYLATDRVTGRPRGFAFVSFATPEEAKLATEKMNGAELDGRAISVSEAKARDEAGGTTVAGRTYTSPNRKAGAFHQRGNRRH